MNNSNRLLRISEMKRVLFSFKSINKVNTRYKMNKMSNKFLFARDGKLMPKMHLGSPISAHSACGSFIKNRKNGKTLRKRRFKIHLLK